MVRLPKPHVHASKGLESTRHRRSEGTAKTTAREGGGWGGENVNESTSRRVVQNPYHTPRELGGGGGGE